jgi:GDP-L-fucose synthase
MNLDNKIYVAGHRGLVGSAILSQLEKAGFTNLIYRSHEELDLTIQSDVQCFFERERPQYVILAAGKVGGIFANNTYPADFIYKNIMIQANVINASYENGVERLLFLGSTCIYPKEVDQPMKEDAILTNVLEPTNEPYALAKIAGIKLCESYNRQFGTDYRSVMPTNLYGLNDNFHLENSHVIPSVMRKLHLAKCIENNDWESLRKDLNKTPVLGISCDSSEEKILAVLENHGIYSRITENGLGSNVSVDIWGSGNVMREFLHVNDMASASIFVIGLDKSIYKSNTRPMLSHINVGTGKDVTIRKMAEMIKEITGFSGKISYDQSKPDGAKRKLIDVSRLANMGWSYSTELAQGLRETYNSYLAELDR